jgi:hypothetical protein
LPIVSPQKGRICPRNGLSCAIGRLREGGWLIRGHAGRSNLSEIATGLLKFDAYCLRNKRELGTMNIQTTPAAKYSSASKIQDVLMVSAFAAWALLLGLSPVLAFHALS